MVRLLEGLRATAGTPQRIAIDNGPEFVSKTLDAWAYQHSVPLEVSRPGKPTDNTFAESFTGHFRAECLDCHWFVSLEEARHTIEAWRTDDNTERPHRALGQETPAAWMTARERLWEAPGYPFTWTNLGGRSGPRSVPSRMDPIFVAQYQAATSQRSSSDLRDSE